MVRAFTRSIFGRKAGSNFCSTRTVRIPRRPRSSASVSPTGPAPTIAAGDFRNTLPRFQADALARNLAQVETLTALARSRGTTPSQLALAWLLHQGKDILPIPGTTRPERLRENLAAAEIVLNAGDLDAIAAAVPAETIEGARYYPAELAMTGL